MGKDSFSFPVGRKKTPFQKHKEQEEERKRKEEEDARKLYDEFVESFGDEPEQKASKRSFTRGGVIQPGTSASSAGLGQKKASKYVPSFLPPNLAAAINAQTNPHTGAAVAAAAISSRLGGSDSGAMPPSAGSSQSERGSKPRNIDKMLENLKREQEAREERQRMRREYGVTYEDDGLGSFDDGDPYTTNLYVGNLAPTVDEEMLKREFVRFGGIASVKIMWPRDDDQRRRGRNCGFVAFMTRAGADRAKAELNGILLHDLELKIGWGKSIVIPPAPLYTAESVGISSAPLKPSGAAVPPPGVDAAPPWTDPHKDDSVKPVGPDIKIEMPKDLRVRFLIDSLASYVVSDGCRFEMAAMSAQGANPEFSFLFDLRSLEHAYYRWRLFSLSSGDSLKCWRIEPFIMVEGGPRWVPPTMMVADGSHQTAAQRGGEAKDKDKPLPDLQRDRFEDLLRAITVSRTDICNAMVFALDNAESATEVVEVLTDALSLPETPVPLKVARLLLASDILHNSTAPVRNASRYRSLLEAALPDIFESLQETYRTVNSRMAQESLRRYVLRVLRVWRSWFIFSDDYINGLQATFLRGPAAGAEENAELAAELEALPDEELETRCRRSGLSKRGGRAAQISRLQALRAYLSGDTVKAEAAAAIQASRKADHEELAANLAAQQAPSVFDVHKEEPEAAQPAIKTEPKTKEEAPSIVSKWSLVDYDNDDDENAVKEEKDTDDIFDDAEEKPAQQKDPSPPPDPLADQSLPKPSPRAQDALERLHSTEQLKSLQHSRSLAHSDSRASGASSVLNGTAEKPEEVDEPRRQRLRQVEVATMLFRDELEESGMEKEEMDAAVAEHRAQLLAEAEKELASRAAQDDAKAEKKARAKDREKEGDKDRDASAAKARSERKRERSAEADASDRRKDKKAPEHKRDSRSERNERSSRQAERKRSRSRSASRDKDRDRDRDRERDRDRDRRRDRSRDVEKERATSKPRESARTPAPAAEEPEEEQKAPARQPSPPMSSAAREAEPPVVQESGGEVSMSIEETNKLRISLGLKPLSAENESDKQRKAQQEREAQKAEEDKAAKAAALAERVKAQKERRLEEEKLRKVKTLGEAADDVDDVSAWINKSRALEEKAKAEARAKALKAAQALEEQDDELLDSDEDNEEKLNNAKELAGMRVRHDADELGEGETMILTLADRNILDEHGEVDEDKDELENALVIEQKKRDKAKRAASKEEHIKPLFGEDGKQRTMLDKYDEEEDTGMEIDESGAFNSDKAKQQAEIRAKLAAAESAANAGAQPSYEGKSEYYTQDEMAAMFKPKKKKKKKALRKREEEEPVDLSFLEAEAASAAAGVSADHGSRAQRGAIAEAQQAKREQDAAAKQARYENALQKANYASLAMKEEQEQEQAADAEDEDELQATLARARRAALSKAQKQEDDEEKPSLDRIAEEAARRREAAQSRESQGGEVLTEMAEYVKGVGRSEEDISAQPKAESSYMGVDDADEAPAQPAAERKQEAPGAGKFGAWVSAEGDGADADEDADMADAEEEEEVDKDEALIHEKAIGRGIGAALELLKDRGDLKAPLQWAGRTNDINEAQRLRNEGQLTDVYTGGRQDNFHAAAIERALTQRDEFGNIMTPKERFRNLCYSFHGKDPSKNKKDKRFRKIAEEQERKRRTMSAIGEDHALSRLAAVQEQSATPYLVLSGKVKPGQSSDPASGYATVEKGALSMAPSLGGGETPLTGARKVEAMLGIKRGTPNGNASMAPPPARKPKTG